MSQSLPCKPCADRGHTCWVDRLVDGVPMCVFCEDGEPCIEEIRRGVTKAKPAPAPEPEAPQAPIRVHEVSKKKEKPSKGVAMRQQVAMCGCGRPASHRGRCVARRNPGKEAPANVATIKIGPELLGPHSVPAAGNGTAHVGERATLQVNEEQLNRFIVGLPLADKARIANAWLMGDL